MGFAWRICRSSSPREWSEAAAAKRSISSASLPLKLEERGRPVVGAVDIDFGRVELLIDDSASDGMVELAMAARYWITFFVFSVFPAPDSPLRHQRDVWCRSVSNYVMRILWLSLSSPICCHARSATAKMCGGFSSRLLVRY
jgi:hypothetical protein